MSPQWKYANGDPILIKDICEALNLGQSMIIRETHFNAVVSKDKNRKQEYGRKAYILGLIRDAYLEAAGVKKKEPKLIIPGG